MSTTCRFESCQAHDKHTLIYKTSRLDLSNVPSVWKFRACVAAAVLGLLCQIYFCFSYDIWFDESFSLQLIRHNYAEVISLTATDIHAPFYYLILKCVVDFGHLLFPGVSPIFFGKFVSVIPYIALLLVCCTKVRRQYGDYVAGIGSVCLVCLRIEYGVEVRMYSFGLLFVTLAFIWLADIVRRWDRRAWTGFVVFSLCAAYTHTYALLAVSALWLSLLVYVCMTQRRRLKAWCIAAVVTIVCYLPWMSVLIGQVEHVSGGFWIGPLTLESLKDLLDGVMNRSLCLLGWLLFALLFTVFDKHRTCGGATVSRNYWHSHPLFRAARRSRSISMRAAGPDLSLSCARLRVSVARPVDRSE